jgi:glycosyltransferase involved in cell wall biosynthesis
MPLDTLNKSKNYKKKFFGFEKNSLDICFVAAKYVPMGIDKGYDVFIEVAKKLVESHTNINFHVVGNFTETDIPINGLESKITFHGFQTLEWFDKFYIDKDVILSPNIPFALTKGAFDGFPTTSCVEAGLRKVAVFCTDELKLNNHFIDNEEIVIVPHDTDSIVRVIEAFYEEPDKLRSIAKKGAAKMREVFSYKSQILPRIRLIESEMHTLWK